MPKKAPVDTLIEDVILNNNASTFIQVGANDGIRNDPMFHLRKKYSLKGILVEPLEHAFNKLKKNFNDDQSVKLVHAAISSFTGKEKFYKDYLSLVQMIFIQMKSILVGRKHRKIRGHNLTTSYI